MDALITAGGVPQPGDPLFSLTNGDAKSLLPLAGKPVLQWVLDAISACPRINTVVVIGLPPQPGLRCEKPLEYQPNEGDLVHNIRSGLLHLKRISPAERYALLVSGDTPGISGPMLDWLIDQVAAEPHDFYYPVVERHVMETRFPGSHRTYARFSDVEVCGGDVMALSKDLAQRALPRIEQLVAARKQPLRQATMIGLDTLLLLMLRRLTLAAAAQRVCARLGQDGVAIPTPNAELGMDVDKPYQLELLENDLRAKIAHRETL